MRNPIAKEFYAACLIGYHAKAQQYSQVDARIRAYIRLGQRHNVVRHLTQIRLILDSIEAQAKADA